MQRGRRIAFDYGDARIGVAICDPDGILATPLAFLDAQHPKLKVRLTELFDEYAPIAIYVGFPKLLSGDEGMAVAKVKDFATTIESLSSAPVFFVDERLSTVDATRKLREAGKNSKDSRSLIDSMAAVSILERGLANEVQ